jgi:hypothetical protein
MISLELAVVAISMLSPSATAADEQSNPSFVTTVVRGTKPLSELAVDSQFVYFVVGPDLMRTPKDGGKPEQIGRYTDLHDLRADETGIYWLDLHGVLALRKGKTEPEMLMTAEAYFEGVAFAAGRLYSAKVMPNHGGRIVGWSEDATSSAPIEIDVTSSPRVLAADHGNVYFQASGGIWAAPTDNRGRPFPIAATGPRTLAATGHQGELYFVDAETVRAVRAGTTAAPWTVLAGCGSPDGILVDGDRLYLATGNGIVAHQIGSSRQRLVPIAKIGALVQDATSLYATAGHDVLRIPKAAVDALPAAATAPLPPPTRPDPAALEVGLSVRSPLYLERRPGRTAIELHGELTVTMKNGSKDEVTTVDLDSIGLVFKNLDTGREHVVVHSCACFAFLDQPMSRVLVLPPGKSTTSDLGGGWTHEGGPFPPPPPGRYAVRYRAVLLRDPLQPEPGLRGKEGGFNNPDRCGKRAAERLADQVLAWSNELRLELAVRKAKAGRQPK